MIENRDTFIQAIAMQLGRTVPNLQKPERSWKHLPQLQVLKDASAEDLVEIFEIQCTNIHTILEKCNIDQLPMTLKNVIEGFQAKSVVYSKDERFTTLNLLPILSNTKSFEWNAVDLKENIIRAEQADVGIVFSEITLAESGTIVVQASPNIGRSLSFLPENSIAIIPKSSLVPRMTQAAQYLRKQTHVSSCINFITGPSNSADIEMNLVVGVHGPMKMTYILVNDL